MNREDIPAPNGDLSPRATKLLLQHLFGPIPQTPKDSLFRPWYVVASRVQPGFESYLVKPKGSISAKLVFERCNSPSRLSKTKVRKKVYSELDKQRVPPPSETLCDCCHKYTGKNERHQKTTIQDDSPIILTTFQQKHQNNFTLPRRNYSTSNHPLRHVYSAHDIDYSHQEPYPTTHDFEAIKNILESPFNSIGNDTPFTSFKIYSQSPNIQRLQSRDHQFLRKVSSQQRKIRRRILTAVKEISEKIHPRRTFKA
jgi:hypothetical protein